MAATMNQQQQNHCLNYTDQAFALESAEVKTRNLNTDKWSNTYTDRH